MAFKIAELLRLCVFSQGWNSPDDGRAVQVFPAKHKWELEGIFTDYKELFQQPQYLNW